jgi:hypothetical protein
MDKGSVLHSKVTRCNCNTQIGWKSSAQVIHIGVCGRVMVGQGILIPPTSFNYRVEYKYVVKFFDLIL